MEIVRLPTGKQASVDADCIRIEEQATGTYTLTASAMCTGTYEGDSVSIGGLTEFDTFEEAEEVGLAWAADVGVQRLFVSTGSRAQPLELREIDEPL